MFISYAYYRFLLSAEYCETEEDATAKANELISRLVGSSSGEEKKKDDVLPVIQRVNKISLADQLNEENDNFLYGDTSNKRSTVNTIITEDQHNNTNSKNKSKGTKSNNKPTAADIANEQINEIENELYQARINAVKSRWKNGAYRGAIDATNFTLANPGGGQPLLEDAACRLVYGKRYGLIGRNGMGKSTMLRAFAARRVGDVPSNVSVHYVSQEVKLTEEERIKTPIELVVAADIERTLLCDELAILEGKAANGSLDEKGSIRHAEVLTHLSEINSDSAPRRAEDLLINLGFSEELRNRPLAELSGGWRVRTMLAAAIFAKPDMCK